MTTSGTQLKSCREEEGRSAVADGPFHTITWAGGQISGLIDEISSVSDIVDSILTEFKACQTRISTINLNINNDQ